MRVDVDVRSIKVIPKSVLKIGVKLPEMVRGGSKEQQIKSAKYSGTIVRSESEPRRDPHFRDLAENPFIQHDQRAYGKTIFRPTFSAFGQTCKTQWRDPPTPHPLEVEIDCKEVAKQGNEAPQPTLTSDATSTAATSSSRSRQKEKMRRELAAVFRLAKSSQDLAPPEARCRPLKESDEAAQILVSPKKVVIRTGRDLPTASEESNSLVKIRGWVSSPSVRDGKPRAATLERNKKNLATCHVANVCYRCGQPVYPLERLEPLAGQHYHPQCFRCWECQTKLTLATFCSSTSADEGGGGDGGGITRLFCRAHQPKMDKVMLCRFSTRRAFPAFSTQRTDTE